MISKEGRGADSFFNPGGGCSSLRGIICPLVWIGLTDLPRPPSSYTSGGKTNFKCALPSDCWRCHWNYIDSTSATRTLHHPENTGNNFYGNGSHPNRLSSDSCTSGRSASDCQWGWKSVTGYSLSEGLILSSIKLKWWQIVRWIARSVWENYKFSTWFFDIQNNLRYIHNMYWTCNSMDKQLS